MLPGTLNSLANSVSGWSIPMMILVWFAGGGIGRSAATGALVFVAECAGYSVVSTIRGHFDIETSWALIGMVAGPILGACTAFLRSSHRFAVSVGSGIIAGTTIGEAIRGFLFLPDAWGTWLIFLGIGGLFMAGAAVRSLRSIKSIVLQIVVASTTAASFTLLLDPVVAIFFH
jgi:hypothetical protein